MNPVFEKTPRFIFIRLSGIPSTKKTQKKRRTVSGTPPAFHTPAETLPFPVKLPPFFLNSLIALWKSRFLMRFKQKNRAMLTHRTEKMVEVTGFEPATFWSRTKRATKLRYTSKMEPMKGLEPLTCGLRNRCSTD